MQTKLPLAGYQSILAVMLLLDCGVIEDVDSDGTGTPQVPLFALGDEAIPFAGLSGFTASPSFHSLLDLDIFCSTHMSLYRSAAVELERTNAYPVVWFWEVSTTV